MPEDDRRRYLIVGAGRSGSSLLSAILADAGAEFDLPSVESWDASAGGAYEHPRLDAAFRWYALAGKIGVSLWPDALGRGYCQRRMARELSRLLARARFAKHVEALWLVPAIVRLGYRPCLIVSYRAFDDYAASYVLRGRSLSRVTSRYLDIYPSALLQLGMFGGCAIGYEDVVDTEETRWTVALGQVTGLSPERLLDARLARVRSHRRREWPKLHQSLLDPRVADVHAALCALKGKSIESGYFGGDPS